MSDAAYTEREVEALLFAAAGPLSDADLAKRLPEGADVAGGPRGPAGDRYVRPGRRAGLRSPAAGASRPPPTSAMADDRRARGSRAACPARGAGDAGDHRLPAAGHPRGNRGGVGRSGQQGVSLDVALLELGSVRMRGPQADARAGQSTAAPPTPSWSTTARPASAICPARRRCAPRACSRSICRPTSRCPIPMHWAPTRTRWSLAMRQSSTWTSCGEESAPDCRAASPRRDRLY